MKVSGKAYVDVTTELAKVPENNPEIKLDDQGVVWVKVWEGSKAMFVRADSLKTEKEAWTDMTRILLWRLAMVANKADITKAQLKRDLIRCGAISK